MTQGVGQGQPAAQIAGGEEPGLHVLVTVLSKAPCKGRVAEERADPVRSSLDGMHQESGQVVQDLERNAPDGRGDDRPFLPQSLGDRQAEPSRRDF